MVCCVPRGWAQLDICKSNRRHRGKLQECTNSPQVASAAPALPRYSHLGRRWWTRRVRRCWTSRLMRKSTRRLTRRLTRSAQIPPDCTCRLAAPAVPRYSHLDRAANQSGSDHSILRSNSLMRIKCLPLIEK